MLHPKSQWYKEICEISKLFQLPRPTLDLKYDVEAITAAALKNSQDWWWKAAKEKPKLRTYVDFSDIDDPRTLVKANLPHFFYSCSKLKPVRKAFYGVHFPDTMSFKALPDAEKTKLLMTSDMIKNTGIFVENLFNAQRDALCNKNTD